MGRIPDPSELSEGCGHACARLDYMACLREIVWSVIYLQLIWSGLVWSVRPDNVVSYRRSKYDVRPVFLRLVEDYD